MKSKSGAVGVVVRARLVPVALQERVKEELKCIEEQGVITKTEVRYLGHVLTATGLRVDPKHVQDILEMPTQKNSSERALQDLLQATNEDATLGKRREYASTAWPLHEQDVPKPLRTYWECRDEIHEQDGLVFRSSKVIVPQSKTSELTSTLHSAHD
ncbi:uncharacterized protein LOC125757917 [Rhipicephalus sanguineus]|uniref:uncharacterized protein LOC125757917 n=1 Tax=Rhipicephalus sanguineus TaxID=34632 RepID=UPI0020C3D820|nr:uncharacterized protein LOC125757917 [Rhipicephalus sanguineus]